MTNAPDNKWLALIFNEDGRDGSQHDIRKLEDCFGQFGENFHVQTYNDTKSKMLAKINQLSNDTSQPFKNYNSVIVVVMCHSSDTEYIHNHIFYPLHKLDGLEDKNFVLISQSCRGDAFLIDHEADGAILRHIIWYSTGDGLVAIRPSTGTPFIHGVCENLLAGARANTDVATIIRTSQFVDTIQPTYKAFYNEYRLPFYLPPINDA